ncbi:hypothetical protein FF011L_51790 [Roseimaritima multifibrata]|uniref:Methanolan biosynthesis EpsI domain-containing protein n=1 Tax=Roseimaritima multifibrata TaxID=1930274 RepID=A0A517MNC1_9BACT|nr:exosortase-associated EpsI family protein [Roseimaritima multifibrata]QDS96371.1 hypothetical protein FF011L_51790 [Roseimaritima multifibrata]
MTTDTNPIENENKNAPATDPGPRFGSRRKALIVVVGAILISGIVHGYLDGRWVDQVDVQALGSELNQLPEKCGDWELVAETDLESNAADLLQCYGSTVREYVQPATGQRVNLAVLFGPRGPIAVHTPEVCYSSKGTEPAGDRVQAAIAGSDRFWKTQFKQRGANQNHLEVWYGWSDGGAWQAVDYPRVWMTDRLYKIQVASALNQETGESPINDFLQDFLPELKSKMHP